MDLKVGLQSREVEEIMEGDREGFGRERRSWDLQRRT